MYKKTPFGKTKRCFKIGTKFSLINQLPLSPIVTVPPATTSDPASIAKVK